MTSKKEQPKNFWEKVGYVIGYLVVAFVIACVLALLFFFTVWVGKNVMQP